MARSLDDTMLVAAAQEGDRNAVDELLRRHYDRIHAVCRRIAGSTRDADDACQEALVKIVRSLPRFDGRSSFGTWAYRIATNASLDELRRRNRGPMLHAVDDEHRPDIADPSATEPMDQYGDHLLLDRALAELSEDLRLAVVMRDVGDLDYAEIAETLDIPIGTVKSRISRGRAALASALRLDTSFAIGNDTGTPVDVEVEVEVVTDDLDNVTLRPGNQIDPPERPTNQT